MPIPELTQPTLLRFDYVPTTDSGQAIVFTFAHPNARQAVATLQPIDEPPSSAPIRSAQGIEILFIPSASTADTRWKAGARAWLAAAGGSAVTARAGDLHAQWTPGRAVIAGPGQGAHEAIESAVEFAYYEEALRQVEEAIAAGWSGVQADTPLTHAVTTRDLESDAEFGRRMGRVLHVRLQLSRIEPLVLRPSAHLPTSARELGEALRDEALCEDRLETADGQIESQEYVYELASQRIGESRHAREAFVLEMAIIVLLGVEVLLIIFEVLWHLE